MTNDFYNHDDGYPAFGAQGSSSAMRLQFDKIMAGFDRMPALTGNGGKLFRVNALGTAMEAFSAFTDTTDYNVSTLAHGLTPKLPGGTTLFLRGDGAWGAQAASSIVRVPRISNMIVTSSNAGNLIDYTSGTFSQTFDPAATLGSGWYAYFRNNGSGTITLDPDGTETIDGNATLALATGEAILLLSDGTNLYKIQLQDKPLGDHEVVVHTGTVNGSTNTHIRRFTTTLTNVGTAITYADSATLGASFTINEPGLYAIHYAESGSAVSQVGISLNSAGLTTPISSITISNRVLMFGIDADLTLTRDGSRIVRLASSDVIRAHNNNTGLSIGNNSAFLAIRKVGV